MKCFRYTVDCLKEQEYRRERTDMFPCSDTWGMIHITDSDEVEIVDGTLYINESRIACILSTWSISNG